MLPMNSQFIDNLRFNKDGLIPAISQDWLDGAVLMLAWMNRSAIEHTLKSGEVHFWSRSRQELWHKGATSGHRQVLKEFRYDCDADAILLSVQQIKNIACHTGARSCFFEQITANPIEGDIKSEPPADSCSELFRVIEYRQAKPEEKSYTNRLLSGGDNLILKKIGEETAEFVMACKDEDAIEIANEAADLIFHLQVALANHKVGWRDVLEVLKNRRNAPRRG